MRAPASGEEHTLLLVITGASQLGRFSRPVSGAVARYCSGFHPVRSAESSGAKYVWPLASPGTWPDSRVRMRKFSACCCLFTCIWHPASFPDPSQGQALSPAAPGGFRGGEDFLTIAQRWLISICILRSATTRKRVPDIAILLNVLVRESASLGVGLGSLRCPSPHLRGSTEAEVLDAGRSEQAQRVGPG